MRVKMFVIFFFLLLNFSPYFIENNQSDIEIFYFILKTCNSLLQSSGSVHLEAQSMGICKDHFHFE